MKKVILVCSLLIAMNSASAFAGQWVNGYMKKMVRMFKGTTEVVLTNTGTITEAHKAMAEAKEMSTALDQEQQIRVIFLMIGVIMIMMG